MQDTHTTTAFLLTTRPISECQPRPIIRGWEYLLCHTAARLTTTTWEEVWVICKLICFFLCGFQLGPHTTPTDEDEDTASYWLKLGSALANSGRYEEAAKAFDRAIELDPNDTEAWNNRGIVLSILKRNKEAIPSFEKATSIDPRNAEAWYNRGMVFCSMERYEDAVESLEKALEIDPQSAIAWHNKGVALKLLGRDTEARIAFACAGRIGTS